MSHADLPAGDEDRLPLNPIQSRALESLRREGLAMVPFAALIEDPELWGQLDEEVGGFISGAEQRIRERAEQDASPARERGRKAKRGKQRQVKKSDFIIRATAIDGLSPSRALLRYALSSQLLGISNAYLGVQSKLVYADMWYTAPSPEDAERRKSQRWHRDHIDAHIVKVFTYFSDVDADSGALEYVRGSAEGGPYGDLWAWSEGEHYPPVGELERLVPPSARVSAGGPSGTIVLCDTGGFHRGGFARKPRITANFTYASPASLAERKVEAGDDIRAELSPEGRFAIA
jgi:hypothetical protein